MACPGRGTEGTPLSTIPLNALNALNALKALRADGDQTALGSTGLGDSVSLSSKYRRNRPCMWPNEMGDSLSSFCEFFVRSNFWAPCGGAVVITVLS